VPASASAAPARPGRTELLALAGLVLAAAAVRLYEIGDQSYWLDEAFTVDLVERSFGGMLATIPETESTPPLYYMLAWLWAKLFGTGEAALRSLSALFGTLTVPVVWRAGRELFNARVGLVAAALTAFNPYFVWYSQEARSYALLVLLAALSVLFFARALRRQTGRAFAQWVVVAALALATHYFAIFILVPKAAWLIYATRRRAAWAAAGTLALVAAALAPLALHQRSSGNTRFIEELGLLRRVVDLPKKLVTGELGTPTPLIGPLAGLITAAAIAYALSRREWRRTELVLLGLALATVVLPLALALLSTDYLLPRNVIVLYVPLVLAVAAGLGAGARLGLAGAAAICAVGLVVNLQVAAKPTLQRDDWRGAAEQLGPATEQRAVVVTPDFAKKPLRLYAGPMPDMPPEGVAVREVVLIGNDRPPEFAAPKPPPGFTAVESVTEPSYVLTRYRSNEPVTLTPGAAASARFGPKPAAILIQIPGKDPTE
jgi:4-amino-4-deoxy-L-arabinose transferase-like glycosyltransferase